MSLVELRGGVLSVVALCFRLYSPSKFMRIKQIPVAVSPPASTPSPSPSPTRRVRSDSDPQKKSILERDDLSVHFGSHFISTYNQWSGRATGTVIMILLCHMVHGDLRLHGKFMKAAASTFT